MRFYGRERELQVLREAEEASHESSQFTVVLGRRRIGKTTLMLKSLEGVRSVYLFVTRVAEPILCDMMQRSAEEAGVEIPGRMTRIGDLLTALMIHSRMEPLTVVIDEFQELGNVDRSIYGDIQRAWDLHKDSARINLVVGGSVHSMMVRIFEDGREPLFGRATRKLEVRPFPVSMAKRILQDHNPSCTREDVLMLHLIAGGVPSYIGALMDSGATDRDSMLRAVVSPGSVFLREGRDMMFSEFGRDNRTYLSILQLIASGTNRRSDMEDVLGTTAGEYLRRLETEHGFIRRRMPMFTDDTRMGRWVISDMYLAFYFRYIQPNEAYVESGRTDLLERAISRDLPSYEGRVLEDYFARRIAEEGTYTDIGGYWNRRGDVEIDIVVLDSVERRAELIEVKRNPEKLDMADLRRKADTVMGHLRGYEVELRGLSMEDV